MNNPKAVVGTNSWGSAAYEKIILGSVVDKDTLQEAMKKAVCHHESYLQQKTQEIEPSVCINEESSRET